MPYSRLDLAYRKVLVNKLFRKGWGCPKNLLKLIELRKTLANRDVCCTLVDESLPITLTKDEIHKDCQIIEGQFLSPLDRIIPGLMEEEVKTAYFQMVLPLNWLGDGFKPICIHLARTGDHFYTRRRNIMAKPLLKHGIGAVILENPFYGLRKPKEQVRSGLCNVSDIFVMGACLILECIVLLRYFERSGFGPLGITGLSMGGHMASLAAASWPKPIALIPCLSWTTASPVFTEGVLSTAIDWEYLQTQYLSQTEYSDTISKLCYILDETLLNKYTAGTLLNETETVFGHQNVCDKGKEAVVFMRGIMDEFTHLSNYPVPFDTSLVIAVCAKSDAFVPKNGCPKLEELWPGSTVKYLNSGHISAYILHRRTFRKAIIEAFERAKSKYTPTF